MKMKNINKSTGYIQGICFLILSLSYFFITDKFTHSILGLILSFFIVVAEILNIKYSDKKPSYLVLVCFIIMFITFIYSLLKY